MLSAPGVRARRNPPRAVAAGAPGCRSSRWSGPAASLGRAVVERLVARTASGALGEPTVSRVLALDVERGPAQGATWRVGAIDGPGVAERLRGADVVVLLAAPTDLAAALAEPSAARRERVVRTAQATATAAAAVGARRLVAVTSAMVLGAEADNPVPLPDDAPVRALPDDGVVGDLLEVEQVLARVPRTHPAWRSPCCGPRRSSAPASTRSSAGTSRRPGCWCCATRARSGSSATSTTWPRRWR
ncbi:hypothetical protein GCM10025868_37580 [Angustibacter aerolatus]|uniref:NAD(P)-binding domain-containing protein n=1 Tax=Angustibacter aerolatus TaxID=1162965 RepID=A0ABQ6JKJ5_9ACTN|nr:hypothetical protein [Angustibacter aerolatus]GMA88508.1 hypothetical protein GCM10025868_37580 [Angustibacter aerolatus]